MYFTKKKAEKRGVHFYLDPLTKTPQGNIEFNQFPLEVSKIADLK